MKSTAKFVPFLIVVSMVTALLIGPASAADGTVTLDKSFITTVLTNETGIGSANTDAGVLTVTVADADLNTGVAVTGEASGTNVSGTAVDYTISEFTGGGTLAGFGTFFGFVGNAPILDGSDADSAATVGDVTLTSSDSDLAIVNGNVSTGLLQFQNLGSDTIAANATFTLAYTAAGVQDATVNIKGSSAAGIDLTIRESGADTGSFAGTFRVGDADVTSFDISGGVNESDLLGDGSNLAFDINGNGTSTDANVTSTTETLIGFDMDADGTTETSTVQAIQLATIPTFPVRPQIAAIQGSTVTANYDDGGTPRITTAAVETTRPVVSVSSPATALSTRVQSTRLVAQVTDGGSLVDKDSIAFTVLSAETIGPDGTVVGTLATSTSGVYAEAVTSPTAVSGGYEAESKILGVPDNQTTLITWRVSAVDTAGNYGYSDTDAADTVVTDYTIRVDLENPAFVSTNPIISGGHYSADDGLVVAAASGLNTSIAVKFNEDLDGSSVQTSDFNVDAALPVSAEWYDSTKSVVYLTVSAIASDAKPSVSVVGNISDTAGNGVTTIAAVAAIDSISPTLTVTISPLLDQSGVTIDVLADEPLQKPPTVKVNGATTGLTVPSLVGTNLFRSTFSAAAGTTQSYNVEITANDVNGNSRTEGEAAHSTDGALLFEIDNAIPAPTIDFPGGSSTVYTQNPLIVIDWGAEGTEYGLDSGGALTTTAAGIATNLDTHTAVTISSITLNDVDVSASLNTESVNKFVLALDSLALQEHTLKITATDDAANSVDIEQVFTVAARPAFSLGLVPGWNLVSIPAEATTPAINDVIAADHPIDIVLTYDPSVAGSWLTATRGSDGLFAGSLSEIKATRAYWIHTNSFTALSVSINFLEGGVPDLPSDFKLVSGWNLVPVLDITGGIADGDTLATVTGGDATIAAYVGAAPRRTYEYDSVNNQFKAYSGSPKVGSGYWVYMDAAQTVVP